MCRHIIFSGFDLLSGAQAFQYGSLSRAIAEGVFDGFYFLGDAAYQACSRVLTPFQGNQSEPERTFSFYQSSLRIHVERAFGLLINRFGILWRPLACAHRRISLVLGACMGLHNFIITEENLHELAPPSLFRGARSHERPYFNPDGVPEHLLAGNTAMPYMDARHHGMPFQDPPMAQLRKELMNRMQQHGMQAPKTRGDTLSASMA